MRQGSNREDRVGPGTALSATALGAVAAATLGWLTLTCWQRVAHTTGGDAWGRRFEVAEGLEIILLAAAGLVSAWLAALLLVGTVAALPGARLAPLRSWAAPIAPRLGPRIAAGLVSTVVVLTPVGAAHAAPEVGISAVAPPSGTPETGTHGADTPGADTPGTGTPEPGWRPTGPPRPAGSSTAIDLVSRGTAAPDSVVVRSGDTLWDITARHLGADADAATIATVWPLWFEANRDVIGADPDLILPGTRLVPPSDEALASAMAATGERVSP